MPALHTLPCTGRRGCLPLMCFQNCSGASFRSCFICAICARCHTRLQRRVHAWYIRRAAAAAMLPGRRLSWRTLARSSRRHSSVYHGASRGLLVLWGNCRRGGRAACRAWLRRRRNSEVASSGSDMDSTPPRRCCAAIDVRCSVQRWRTSGPQGGGPCWCWAGTESCSCHCTARDSMLWSDEALGRMSRETLDSSETLPAT